MLSFLHCNFAIRKRNHFLIFLLQTFPMATHWSVSITGIPPLKFHLKFQYSNFWLQSLILVSYHTDIHRLFFDSIGTSSLWILLFFSWSVTPPQDSSVSLSQPYPLGRSLESLLPVSSSCPYPQVHPGHLILALDQPNQLLALPPE